MQFMDIIAKSLENVAIQVSQSEETPGAPKPLAGKISVPDELTKKLR